MIKDIESKILKCKQVIESYQNEINELSKKLLLALRITDIERGYQEVIDRYCKIVTEERLKLKLLEDNILDKKKDFLFIYSSHCEIEFEFHHNVNIESALKCFLQKHNDVNILQNEISNLSWNDYKSLNTILKAFEFQNDIYLFNIIEISNVWFEGEY